MTKNIANVEISTDNFAAWLTKTNQLLEAIRHDIMTVSNTTLSVTTGNAALIGRFTSDILVANVALRGGNNSVSANLSITSQVNVANTLRAEIIRVSNSTTNVVISPPTADQIANTSMYLHANGSWVYVNIDTFAGTANNALNLAGIPSANYVQRTGDYAIAGDIAFNGNVTIGSVFANGSYGPPGAVLASNGTKAYWLTIAGLELPGANSEIVFNDSGDFGSDSRYYYIRASNKVVLGNTTVNTAFNEDGLFVGNSSVNVSVTRNQINIGNEVSVNSVIITTGVAGLIANTTAIKVGTNTTILSGSFGLGNTVANLVANSISLTISNSTASVFLDPNKVSIGNTTVNNISNSVSHVFANSSTTAVFGLAGLTVGASIVNSTSVAVGANAFVNTTAVAVINATTNTIISVGQVNLANSTSNTKISIPTVAERAGNYFLHANGSWTALFGKVGVPINAFSMVKQTTNGAALGTVETGNQNMHVTYDFDASTQEHVQFQIPMPSGWNEGNVTFQAIWSHAATTTNFGVVWQLAACAAGDGDTMNVAFGTANLVSDTGTVNNFIYVTPESGEVAIAGAAAGDLVMFRVSRVPANANDTMAVDARLHAVRLYMTVDSLVDVAT